MLELNGFLTKQIYGSGVGFFRRILELGEYRIFQKVEVVE